MPPKIPKLPQLLNRKIYKVGQTRGADDDVIYQNRVSRNSTVLIPYPSWTNPFPCPPGETHFENGFIVLISPNDYFGNSTIDSVLDEKGLKIGTNTLVFYETREQWDRNNPDTMSWTPAQNRNAPLGGQYVARVPATTASDGGEKIVRGFKTTSTKGAGIRVFEYANTTTNEQCRFQLEALFWHCYDSELVASNNGMTKDDATKRKEIVLNKCADGELLDFEKLIKARSLNRQRKTICPLCLEELSGSGFFNRMQQAEGREIPDLTVTEINLFHIEELRTGIYNHCPYNLGWGHHHCNVVTKDSGIMETLHWLDSILQKNIKSGYFEYRNSVG